MICVQKHYCCSAFLYWNVSLIEELIHLRLSVVQRFLLYLPRIKSRQYLIISSIKSYLPLKLSTDYSQEKSSQKKNHADSEYFSHAC